MGGAEAQYVQWWSRQQSTIFGAIKVSPDPLGGGETFGAPGIAGYKKDAQDSKLVNYVDRGDPVGNFASDAPTPEPGIAQANSDHVGIVRAVPSDKSENVQAGVLTANASTLFQAASAAVLGSLVQAAVDGIASGGVTWYLWQNNHVLEHYPNVIPNIKFDPTAIFKPTGTENIPSNPNAGFSGHQVTARVLYQPNANSSPVVLASDTATVASGVTTPFPDIAAHSTGAAEAMFGSRVIHAGFTFNGNQFAIGFPASEEGTQFATGGFNGYDFQTPASDPSITGVSLTSTNIPSLSASNLSYTAHDIRINLAGLTLPTSAPSSVLLTATFGSSGSGTPPTASAKISSVTSLSLPTMSFLSENGSDHIISAHTSGETLVGSSQNADTFRGTLTNLNGDLIKLFGGNDVIDVTDLNFARATLAYSGTETSGTLSLSDGIHISRITLAGAFSQANFHLMSDMHGGTNVTYG